MFSPQTRAMLFDNEPNADGADGERTIRSPPAPSALPSVSVAMDQPPFAAPVARSRMKLWVLALAAVQFIGLGAAILGFMDAKEFQNDGPSPLPQGEAVAKSTRSDCLCGNCDCTGTCVCSAKEKAPKSTEKAPKTVVFDRSAIPPAEKPQPAVIKEVTPTVQAKEDHGFKLVNLEKPKEKPKIAVEETSNKSPEKRLLVYESTVEGLQAGQKADKPVLVWAGGIHTKPEAKAAMDLIGDKAVHVIVEKQGNACDRLGPRVYLEAPNDNTWYIKADKFSATTGERIASILPKRNYANVKFPQAEPPATARHRNTSEGLCLSASLDTLAEYHGYNLGLVEGRNPLKSDSHKNPWSAVKYLNSKGVKAQWTAPGFRDIGYLRKACDEGLGATVGVNMNHEINVVGVNDTHVALIDNNDPALKTRVVKRESFNRVWDGTSIVIFPEGKEHVLRMWGQCGPDGCVPNRELDGNAQFLPGSTGQFSPTGSARSEGGFSSRFELMRLPPQSDSLSYRDRPATDLDFWLDIGYTEEEARQRAGRTRSGVWR